MDDQKKTFLFMVLVIICTSFFIRLNLKTTKDFLKLSTAKLSRWYSTESLKDHTTKLITRDLKCEPNLFLVILVTSHAWEGHMRRIMVRDTWGYYNESRTPAAHKWQTFFTVASRVENLTSYEYKAKTAYLRREKVQYKDIIEGDFTEDFFHLSYKLQIGFEWVTLYCSTSYVAKTDDDCFVNTKVQLPLLNSLPRTNLYTGHVVDGLIPFRDKTKYGVSKEEWEINVYPTFASGATMTFSSDVISKIVDYFPNDKVFKLEDVYIGILLWQLGIKITDIDVRGEKKVFDVAEGEKEKCRLQKNTTVVYAVYFTGEELSKCIYKLFEDNM